MFRTSEKVWFDFFFCSLVCVCVLLNSEAHQLERIYWNISIQSYKRMKFYFIWCGIDYLFHHIRMCFFFILFGIVVVVVVSFFGLLYSFHFYSICVCFCCVFVCGCIFFSIRLNVRKHCIAIEREREKTARIILKPSNENNWIWEVEYAQAHNPQ